MEKLTKEAWEIVLKLMIEVLLPIQWLETVPKFGPL